MSNELKDNFKRKIDYLRLSITDRCNLRCTYCMPESGVRLLDRRLLLTYEELIRVIKILANIGIKKVRLTGGEPLLRNDIISLLNQINEIDSIEYMSLTTNGILLKNYIDQLYRSGINGLNISLDSLDQSKYKLITRGGEITRVIEGIDNAVKLGFESIKINVVLTNMLDKNDIIDFIKFSQENPVTVRFIEMMPVSDLEETECNRNILPQENPLVSINEIMSIMKRSGNYILEGKNGGNGPAFYYGIPGHKGKIGYIINNKTACSNCNRIRLTPQGTIKLCLFSSNEWSIRDCIRSGHSDEEIERIMLDFIRLKPKDRKHDDSDNPGNNRVSHFMSKIGG